MEQTTGGIFMKKFVSLLLVLFLFPAGAVALGEAPSITYGDSMFYPALEAATWSGGKLKLTISGYGDYIVINGTMYLPFYPYVVVNGEKYSCVKTEDFYSKAPSFYFECADAPDEVWLELLVEGEGEPVLLAQVPEVAEAPPVEEETETPREISPVLGALALGMGYDEALALTALTPFLSNDGSKSLNGELESWGTLGSLKLDFDADGALCYYEWYHQIGKPSCTLLNEVDRSETAQADSEAVYRAMCDDMLALAGVGADDVTPLSYSSDGGQYTTMVWKQGASQRVCMWVANPLDYFFCRLTVTTE